MRRGDANICSSTSVYVPQFVEDDDVDGVDYKYSIGWEVNHKPPSWARYWNWGKAKNKLTDFVTKIKSYSVSLKTRNAYDLAKHIAISSGLMKFNGFLLAADPTPVVVAPPG